MRFCRHCGMKIKSGPVDSIPWTHALGFFEFGVEVTRRRCIDLDTSAQPDKE